MSSGVAAVVARSKGALAEMWQTQRERVKNIPKLGPGSSARDAFLWLQRVATDLPALSGSEMNELVDLVRKGLFSDAQATLDTHGRGDLVAAVPVAVEATVPVFGQSFALASAGLELRWIPGAAGQLGFWCATKNPTKMTWDASENARCLRR